MAMMVKKTQENKEKEADLAIKADAQSVGGKVKLNKVGSGAQTNKTIVAGDRKTLKNKVAKTSLKAPATGITSVTVDGEFGKVFNFPQNPSLLAQYIRVYQANQRQGNAKTKTRGEVAGSGKKPWKQKGTGRARVGSIRNPVWRHGGVSHGPVLKDWSLDLPKKMRAKVFITALSQKISVSQVFLVDKFDLQEGRTKELATLLQGWQLTGSVLLVSENQNPNLITSSANLQNIKSVVWTNLNTYQLVAHKHVVFEKHALEKLKEKYAKN